MMMMMLVIKNCAETEPEQTDGGDLLAAAAAAYFDFDFDFRCSFIAR